MVLFLLALSGGPVSFDALVSKVSARLASIRTFEARFTQRVTRPAMRKRIDESGTVAIQKPGRMRWEYRTPEEKLFVSDGRKTYFYVPEDKQVIVSHGASGALAPTEDSPLALLAGQKRLEEAFNVEPGASPPAVGGAVLRLVPKRPSPEIDEIEIEVEPVGGQLRRVVIVDVQGNHTEFFFEGIRENRRLGDDLFRFTAPRDVEIVLADEGLPRGKP